MRFFKELYEQNRFVRSLNSIFFGVDSQKRGC